MKILFVLFVIVFNHISFSQEIEKSTMFSNFELGLLAGINFSTLTGTSVILEGKTNLTSNLNIKLSFGYSTINKKEGYNVKTNGFISFDDVEQYATHSYTVDKILYDVFPISLGFEYVFLRDKFSPYGIIEVGYNYYTYHTEESNIITGGAGYYNSFDELPSEYKNKPPVISEDESYRVALGIGTNYKLSSVINLDIRYLYQFNKALINTNQILVGINF